MDKITIVFWSQGGNTAAMAAAVAEGVKAAGRETEIVPVSEASLDELKAAEAFAMGCPAMGAEALEEYEMEPFVADVLVDGEGLICHEAPDEDALEQCRSLGKALAEA